MRFEKEFTSRSRYHMLECWLDSYSGFTREIVYGCDLDHILCIGQNGEWSAYFAESEVNKAGELGLAFTTDIDKIKQHETGFQNAGAACLSLCDNLTADTVASFENDAFADRISKFFRAYRRLQAYYQISGQRFMTLAETTLLENLDFPVARRNEIFSYITTGDHRRLKTFQENLDWIRLLLDIKVRKLSIAEQIKLVREHSDKYAYVSIGSDTLGSNLLDKFKTRLAEDLRLEESVLKQKLDALVENQAALQQRREETLSRLHLSVESRAIADGLAVIGVHRLQIREMFIAAAHRSYCLFQRIFQRYQEQVGPMEEDLLRQLSISDILALAGGAQLSRSVVRNRFENGFCYIQHGRKETLSGEAAYRQATRLLSGLRDTKIQQVDAIKGTVGHPGAKVMGRAFVLNPGMSQGEQTFLADSEMQAGDILIAGMTYPSLVSACENAAAIVTDFGGITCHAVIIAREFNIPCLVGTEKATQVIQTGDMVEIDTAVGVIQILKNES